MEPRIEILTEKKLIGQYIHMSLGNNKTIELWKNFMPRRNEIKNNLTTELFSMQVFDSSFDFKDFNPETIFEKWAAMEVSDFDATPNSMNTYILSGGLYAVFFYKGLSTDTKIFQYIYGTWLPASDYLLDNTRPHFEILGEKYKNDDLESEEEIWIPIKEKH